MNQHAARARPGPPRCEKRKNWEGMLRLVAAAGQGAHGPELLAPLARGRRAAAEVLGAAHQARVLPRVPKRLKVNVTRNGDFKL